MTQVLASNSPWGRSVPGSIVLAVAFCVGLGVDTSAQTAATAVRAIASGVVGSEAVITIEATGPLPAPTIGTLDGPPRIFLDFAGVGARTSGLPRTADRRILRVRVAVNSVTPLVTRVVIDLAAQQPHRIEQATGRVLIFVGATTQEPVAPSAVPFVPQRAPAAAASPRHAPRGVMAAPFKPPVAAPPPSAVPPSEAASTTSAPPEIAPVPPLPEPVAATPATATPPPDAAPTRAAPPIPDSTSPGASSGRGPYRPPVPPPPAKDVERYRTQIGSVLRRLRMQQPLLESMESLEEQVPARMQTAMEEFENLRQELSAVKPPESLRTQHDLLMQTTRLGTTAARLRYESTKSSDRAVVRNAASAAAGAILMLDRACADLGCPNPPGR
jgi:hypothetical protein